VLDFLPVNGFTSGNPSSRIVRFSTFEVDLQTGELRQRGQKIRLQEQPFQVLAALLERPGDVVTREELRSKLWPADTFVDFDHSLNAAIKRLRDALGESAEKPIFIETLARRGYRFIGNVEIPATPSALPDLKYLPTNASGPWALKWRFVAAMVAIVAVASVAAGVTIETVASFGNIATFDDERTRELDHHFCDLSGWQVPGIFRQNRSILASPLYR
jgi:DNA-binding winged helix-turn-helix (wHTH) protein